MKSLAPAAEADLPEALPRPVFRANTERARAEANQRRRRTQQRRAAGFSRRRSLRSSR